MLLFGARTSLVIAAIAASLAAAGCGPVRMQVEPALPRCRTTLPPERLPVRWIAPAADGDRQHLRSWCDAVGPVAVHDSGKSPQPGKRSLMVVSWNMAVGEGDLVTLLDEVREQDPDADVILLVQEAYRAKAPPDTCPAGSRRAAALGHPRAPDSEDILDLAARLQLHAAYAPSMRNGKDCGAEPREDRGNAILSTLPISDMTVIELPFAQERRVALAALINGQVGVMSTHFDTLRGHGRMAEAIVQASVLLGWERGFVIGGDFNSALPLDAGLRAMNRHFTEVDCGDGPTHTIGRRLDHMFMASGDQPVPCRTGRRRHGSDHHPLIAVLPADAFPPVAARIGRSLVPRAPR